MQLATFILAILQIAKDVLWFCVIASIVVIAFSQMFFTVLAPDSCSISRGISADVDETRSCIQSEYFLSAYLLLIFQDFDRETFETPFSVFLMVLYSFMIVLVMLNVLIAVASESYEKCVVRSSSLFGRARVMMLAEIVCFQYLLRRNTADDQQASVQLYKAWWSAKRLGGWSRSSVLFFGLVFLILLLWIAGELIVVLSGPRFGILAMSFGSISLTVIIFLGILAFLSCEAHFKHDHCLSAKHEEDYKRSFQEGWFHHTMLSVLGSSRDCTSTSMMDWKGRLLYLKDEMVRLSEETKLHMEEKAQRVELGLKEDMTDIQSRIKDLQEGLETNNQTLMQVCHALKCFKDKQSHS